MVKNTGNLKGILGKSKTNEDGRPSPWESVYDITNKKEKELTNIEISRIRTNRTDVMKEVFTY